MIRTYLSGAKDWCNNLKKQNIKFYILSNTNKKEKVEKVSKELDVPYIMFAKKPFKKGFMEIKEKLNLNNDEIAVVRRPNFNRCSSVQIDQRCTQYSQSQ